MKYSLETAWKAVEIIIPNLVKARDAGCNMNLPHCLKDCAITILLEQDYTSRRLDFDWCVAKDIVRILLDELREVGYMEFGNEVRNFKKGN